MNPFSPTLPSVSLACSQASNSAVVKQFDGAVRIFNAGTATAYVNLNGGTALTTGMPIPPGIVEVFSKGNSGQISAICDTGLTTTLILTTGNGQ